MRFWSFGVFDSHFADFTLVQWGGGFRSLYIGGNANQENTLTTVNGTSLTGYENGWGGGADTASAWICKILTQQILAQLGQIPVLLNVHWAPVASETEVATFRLYRILLEGLAGLDITDSSNRYKDKTGSLAWFGDQYFPYMGEDIEGSNSGGKANLGDTPYQAASYQFTNGVRAQLSITALVERALRDNTDIFFLWMNYANRTTFYMNPTGRPDLRPTLEFTYFFPVEFYQDDGAGNLDLTQVIGSGDQDAYYIGAVERGQTGSSIKTHLRNFSGAIAHIEVFDDHPEYRDPIQKVGSGTGALDYVVLQEPAVSQLYTVVFYSSTEFEIKAEAYRDNIISLHPQIDADASWRGNTSTTFNAPEGGLQIPAAAWQPGTLSGDEIEIAVRGNTTNTDWPPDSNDQVEITGDSGGSPDASGWRPIAGRREIVRNSVTIDAATKFIPTRRVLPTDWPTSTPAFIQDSDSIDEGVISSVQEAALGSVTFSGSGLDDFTRSGNYNGNEDRTYRIRIDGTGTPDTFEWSNDGGGSWEATDVPITGALQELESGVWIMFAATTGHTLNDYWEFSADTFGITLSGLSVTSNGYTAGAIIGTTLPFRSVSPAIFAAVNADSGNSQPNPARLYLASTVGFSAGDTVYIQQAGTDTYETAVIDTGGVTATYLQMTAGLANDYSAGDFATKVGAGDAAFWVRPVATTITAEELKRLRINSRIL